MEGVSSSSLLVPTNITISNKGEVYLPFFVLSLGLAQYALTCNTQKPKDFIQVLAPKAEL